MGKPKNNLVMKEIILIGNIGREPKQKTTAAGQTFYEFSVACNEKNDAAMWFSVLYSGNDKVCPFLTKGRQVYIRGGFKVEVYNGAPSISVYARDIQLLSTAEKIKPDEIVPRNEPNDETY